MYQPKTGARCGCKPGVHRDNCPECEGTGMVIDFAAIRARNRPDPEPLTSSEANERRAEHLFGEDNDCSPTY